MTATAQADVKTIADQLVAYCQAGEDEKALDTLYAADAVSVEAGPMPGADSPMIEGLEGIKGKHAWWNSAFEVHSSSVDGPYPHGEDRFAVIFEVDCTEKATNQRMPMKEIGVYTVKGGKIIREEFFYPMGA